MKKYLAVVSILFMSFSYFKTDPIDRLGVPGPLTYNLQSYNLVWSDKPRDTYYIQEYLPDGENVESFNQLLTIHLFDIDITLDDAVQKKVNELNARKKTDATCSFEVNRSADGKEIIVDFLLSEMKNGEMTIAEFNVYRYKLTEIGNNKTALLVYAYSKRSYGDKIPDFYKALKTDSYDIISSFENTELPVINLSGN